MQIGFLEKEQLRERIALSFLEPLLYYDSKRRFMCVHTCVCVRTHVFARSMEEGLQRRKMVQFPPFSLYQPVGLLVSLMFSRTSTGNRRNLMSIVEFHVRALGWLSPLFLMF